MPASFNGVDLGLIFEMDVAASPKSRQVNAYCGANGLEVIDMGSRGGSTVVQGGIVAASAAALAAAEQSIRALQVDGGAYILVDTLGTAWPNVILVQFQPQGRVGLAVNGYLARRYVAQFLHIF